MGASEGAEVILIKLPGRGVGGGGWNGSKNLPHGGEAKGGGCGGPDNRHCGNEGGGWGGGDGGGEISLLLSSFFSGPSLNFSLFLRELSSPGGLGAFFTRSLTTSYQHQVLLIKNQLLHFQHQMLKWHGKKTQAGSISL